MVSIFKKKKQFFARLQGRLKEIAEEYSADSVRPDFGIDTLIRGLYRKES